MDSLIIKDNTVIACSETDILSLKIPEGVTAISDNAFLNFKRLSEIQLPSSLKKIGDRAFEGCESLKLINIENVSMIGVRAFAGCKSLSKIHLSNSADYFSKKTKSLVIVLKAMNLMPSCKS